MAAEQGVEVDREGFAVLMNAQRERARADTRARRSGGAHVEHASRIGTVALVSEGSVGAGMRRLEVAVGGRGWWRCPSSDVVRPAGAGRAALRRRVPVPCRGGSPAQVDLSSGGRRNTPVRRARWTSGYAGFARLGTGRPRRGGWGSRLYET
ncbi:hypothetical protein [Streptomyces sp. SHP 1-2]|uniref:hypothetical protein n=1 Tax=Streptomyces sp. SHP 1-2 TaxID=2769489 RepID=UPI0039E046A8